MLITLGQPNAIAPMPPCIWDIPLGLEDLFRLSSHPFRDPPVSQQKHVISSCRLKCPVEMLVSSCIVVFLIHWLQTNSIFSTWTNQTFLVTLSCIQLKLEQLCSSLETCCLNNHIFSFNTSPARRRSYLVAFQDDGVLQRRHLQKNGRNLAHKANDDIFDTSSNLHVSFIPVSPYPSASSQISQQHKPAMFRLKPTGSQYSIFALTGRRFRVAVMLVSTSAFPMKSLSKETGVTQTSLP